MEMVPRQHSGSDNLIEMSVQNKVWMNGSCKDGGVIPVTGFPRVDGMANEEERARINPDMEQTRASHTSLMHSFTGGHLGVIPLKRAFRGGLSLMRCRWK